MCHPSPVRVNSLVPPTQLRPPTAWVLGTQEDKDGLWSCLSVPWQLPLSRAIEKDRGKGLNWGDTG